MHQRKQSIDELINEQEIYEYRDDLSCLFSAFASSYSALENNSNSEISDSFDLMIDSVCRQLETYTVLDNTRRYLHAKDIPFLEECQSQIRQIIKNVSACLTLLESRKIQASNLGLGRLYYVAGTLSLLANFFQISDSMLNPLETSGSMSIGIQYYQKSLDYCPDFDTLDLFLPLFAEYEKERDQRANNFHSLKYIPKSHIENGNRFNSPLEFDDSFMNSLILTLEIPCPNQNGQILYVTATLLTNFGIVITNYGLIASTEGHPVQAVIPNSSKKQNTTTIYISSIDRDHDAAVLKWSDYNRDNLFQTSTPEVFFPLDFNMQVEKGEPVVIYTRNNIWAISEYADNSMEVMAYHGYVGSIIDFCGQKRFLLDMMIADHSGLVGSPIFSEKTGKLIGIYEGRPPQKIEIDSSEVNIISDILYSATTFDVEQFRNSFGIGIPLIYFKEILVN